MGSTVFPRNASSPVIWLQVEIQDPVLDTELRDRAAGREANPEAEHEEDVLQIRWLRPCLCGVLSSHIGDKKRLTRLQQCLDSVAEQTLPLDGFYVVWSAPDAIALEVEK
ncbi:unnamed protein product, partial [Symbiodinium natans]